MTSFKPVGCCYVHPRVLKIPAKEPTNKKKLADQTYQLGQTKSVEVPVADITSIARAGGSLRSLSAAYQAAYDAEPFTQFPPSGIVMVKDPLHPEQVSEELPLFHCWEKQDSSSSLHSSVCCSPAFLAWPCSQLCRLCPSLSIHSAPGPSFEKSITSRRLNITFSTL
jgi:hypothetical protein